MKKDKKPEREEDKDEFFGISKPSNHFSMFNHFEEQFREMQERMNQFYKDALSENLPDPKQGGPRIYGYTYRVGPDGIPHYQEFTNMDQKHMPQIKGQQQQLGDIREPPVDVQESEKEIYVTAELPGAEKDNIDLEVNDDILKISVENDHNYFKEVKLPSEVKTKKTKAKLNNGILSVTLQKANHKKKGKKIDIE